MITDHRAEVARKLHPARIRVSPSRFGAGLAGGDWKRIEHLIMAHWVLAGIDVTIYDLPAR